MKRFLSYIALFLAAILACSFIGCSTTPKSKYNVGICQLVSHAAHDEATRGFIDALNNLLPGEVSFHTETAANEISACSTIINQFIAEDVDLILANATPALQVAAASTDTIPILGTSITEYGAILGLEESNGIVGGNVSGTSDLAPLDKQAEMAKLLFPTAKTVGLLYCSAEVNSKYQVDGMKTELEKQGFTCKYYAFTDSNDLASVTESAAGNCDLIYVPTDNTVAANAPIIANICRYKNVPVMGGDEGICSVCSAVTLCIDYYKLGYTTGEMAANILTGKAEIATMPIAYAAYYGAYNPEICTELGITVPSDYKAVTAQ